MKRLLWLFCFFYNSFSLAQDVIIPRFSFSFGEEGGKPGQFIAPTALSADAQGNLYIADQGNNRLQKFTNKGELVAFIGGFGWGQGQFHYPADVFVYNSLDVFVADYENNRIERYDKDLNWLSSYRSDISWDERYQFFFPRSLFISIHGDFMIADAEHDKIVKLNSSFQPELSFGDFDWGSGTIREAFSIFCDSHDFIYVSDSAAGKVLVYDYFGNYIRDIGLNQLKKPKGLFIDSAQRLFVADAGLDQIFCFDASGDLYFNFGSSGAKLGAFSEPSDVAVFNHQLFVVDTNNHRIQAFDLNW
ncbi:MAG: hypothetical protein EHM72_00295 [Calditrichaeota bacterium]|nr:MAG: hypothetical protein EHM72_00295 [Calditrichota bacterium]